MKTPTEKTKHLELGKTSDGQTLAFDLFKFLESRLLIQASSGGGKSYLLRRIVEETFRQEVPVWIVDPEGEYSTLREKFDLIIFAVEDGDLDLAPETVEQTLPVLLKKGISCVFDLSDLNLDEKRARVVQICQAILALGKPDWKSLLLCLDEAQIFAPEGKSSASIEAVTDLASRIRKRGVGLVVATQRLSALDKNLTSHLLNRIIGYCLEDIEISRAANYIGKNEAKKLQTFYPGDFYALGSALNFRKSTYFHCAPVLTTHPDPSTRRNLAAPPATTELSGLVEELKSSLEISAVDQNSEKIGNNIPENYQTKLTELAEKERELNLKEEDLIAGQKLLEFGHKGIYQKLEEIFTEANLLIESRFDQLKNELKEVFQIPEKLLKISDSNLVPKLEEDEPNIVKLFDLYVIDEAAPFETPPAEFIEKYLMPELKNNSLTRAQQNILDTLANFSLLGVKSMDRSNVAVFSGASPKSSAFTGNLSFLRNNGNLIDYLPDNHVRLTTEGKRYARPSVKIYSLEDLHNAWCRYLSAKQAAMIRYLLKQGPAGHRVPRKYLAQDTSQSETSSAWTANLSQLRKFGLIGYDERNGLKCVYLTKLLFPETEIK